MIKQETTREMLNDRYISAIEDLIKGKVLKTQREFSEKMEESPVIVSQIKAKSRNASISQLAKIINDFDLNANYFLRCDNVGETIKHIKLNIEPTISGNNRDVMVGKQVAKNEGVVHGSFYNVEHLINEAPNELKNHINKLRAKCTNIEKENSRFKDEIGDLKKIITSMTTQINEAQGLMKEKDERLYKAQCELIEVYKNQKS